MTCDIIILKANRICVWVVLCVTEWTPLYLALLILMYLLFLPFRNLKDASRIKSKSKFFAIKVIPNMILDRQYTLSKLSDFSSYEILAFPLRRELKNLGKGKSER